MREKIQGRNLTTKFNVEISGQKYNFSSIDILVKNKDISQK